jgi:hypothetical protein
MMDTSDNIGTDVATGPHSAAGSLAFLPITEAMKRFPPGGPSLRFVRDRMKALGFAKKVGRSYYTTAGQIDRFMQHVVEYGLCKQTKTRGQSSSRRSEKATGSPVAGSRSASRMVRLPADDLKEALALTSRRGPSAKPSVTG